MKRNTRTTIARLNIGDRFYKANDRSKKVYERVQGEKKTTAYRTYLFWCKADDSTEPKAMDRKTEVVFLRSNPDADKPVTPTRALPATTLRK